MGPEHSAVILASVNQALDRDPSLMRPVGDEMGLEPPHPPQANSSVLSMAHFVRSTHTRGPGKVSVGALHCGAEARRHLSACILSEVGEVDYEIPASSG